MSLLINDIKIKSITAKRNEKGELEVSGSYDIMSEKGIVVASQIFNGYSDNTVAITGDIKLSTEKTIETIRNEIKKLIGLE